MESDYFDKELKKIGDRLKQLRVDAGIETQQEFCDRYNFQQKQLWRLESGENFQMTTLLRILEIHNLTLKEFFDGIEE